MHTRRCVRTFWALDRSRAQARFFPAIHPLQSYSADVDALARWWQAQGNPDWSTQRKRLLELLESQVRLERMARIVGKDALPPAQQLTLLCADLINDAVLRQSSFSDTDRYCSPRRQTEILSVVIRFVDLARAAVEAGVHPDDIGALSVRRTLQRIGEDFGEDRIADIRALWKQLDSQFSGLPREPADAR